jgi:hypothetical protein
MFRTIATTSLLSLLLAGAAGFAPAAGTKASPAPAAVKLFADDFSSYPPAELLDTNRYGSRLGQWRQTSLHYAWHSRRFVGWRQATLPWRIIDRDGRRWLDQPEKFFNVVLKAGNPQWRDYTLELDLAVNNGPAGPLVRYKTSRQNYWIAFETGQPVKLIRRDQNDHITLGTSAGLTVEKDRVYHCRVDCDGSRITVAVDGKQRIAAVDDAYSEGQIGLRTEAQARFTAVKVTTTPAESERLAALARRSDERLAQVRQAMPKAKAIHTITLPDAPGYLHVQDVNDDGVPEVINADLEIMSGDYARITRLSVYDWNGKLLWRLGEKRAGKLKLTSDVAFNAGDVDGDGHTEILITRDFEILILDGATGKIKRKGPTPLAAKGEEDLFKQVVGDSFIICNLRGRPTPQDFILKDRYHNLWAYTCELKPLWHRSLNTGHYPHARDINGDGKDEVMAGYSMLASDGTTMWTVPGSDPDRNRFPGPEHADAVLVERFGLEPNAPIRIAIAASDMGFLLLDTQGHLLAQHRIGHAQSLAAGRFRPDLPGRQFLVRTQWGNQNIANLFDYDGNLLLVREDAAGGLMPVNWRGDGSVLAGAANALFDGNFDRVVEIGGGGSVRPTALDVNNDGLDEVIAVRGNVITVYAPQGVKPTVPAPKRNLTNYNGYGGFFY